MFAFLILFLCVILHTMSLVKSRVGNLLLLGHCPFGLDVTLILRAPRPVGRAPRPPFIQALGHQGQFKNRNNTANLTTIQYNICLFPHVVCYIENVITRMLHIQRLCAICFLYFRIKLLFQFKEDLSLRNSSLASDRFLVSTFKYIL